MAGQTIKPGGKGNSAELTEAEWAIMKVVWSDEPCAAGSVQEALAKSKNWAYSTVKTTMDRMAEKGFLKITKVRNLQLFSSTVSEIEAKRGELRKMLKNAFDGAHFPLGGVRVATGCVDSHDCHDVACRG